MTDEIRNIPECPLNFQKGDVTKRGSAVAEILKTSGNSIIDVVHGAVQDESYRTILEKIGDCSGNVDQRCFTTLFANRHRMIRMDYCEIATTGYKHIHGCFPPQLYWRAPLQE